MVARRRDLPGLPALVGRRRRRRHGRPARHHRSPAVPARPRRGCRVAEPVLRLADERRRLRRGRLPRHRPAVRLARRRRHDGGHRPRPGPEGARRPRAQPHEQRARLVPGRAGGRPRQPGARALHLPRRPRPERRGAAQQLALGLRRPRLDPGHRGRRHARPVVPAHLRRHPARPELGAPRGAWPSSTTSCGSGATGASTASGSTSPTAWSSARGCPTGTARSGSTTRSTPTPGPPARAATPSSCTPPTARCSTTPPPVPRRCGTRTACTRSTAAGAGCSSAYGAARPHPVRRGLGHAGAPPRALRAPRRDAPGVQLRLPRRPLGRHRAAHRHRGLAALQRRRRGPDHVGAVEPRRRAARVPARAGPVAAAAQRHPGRRPAAGCRARPAPGARRHGADARAARRRLRLPGRGARPARAHDDARLVPPGPDLPPHPRHGHRPRRLPGADAVGQGRAEQRLRPRRHAVAAAARRLRRPRGRPAGGRRGLDPRALPRAARVPPQAPLRARQPRPGTPCRPTPSSPCATPPATASAPCSS